MKKRRFLAGDMSATYSKSIITILATVAVSATMAVNNTFVFVEPTVIVKECLSENTCLDVAVPSLLACVVICSTHPSCRGVSFVKGNRGCIACNGSYVSVTESTNTLTGKMVYEKLADDPCPENWTTYEDSCYHIGKEDVTWQRANSTCFDHDPTSTLVVIDSPDEQDYLIDVLQNHGGEKYWSDALPFDDRYETQWRWASNRILIPVWDDGGYVWSPMGKWAADKILNDLAWGPAGDETYCGYISRYHNYKMSATSCGDTILFGFVCEHNRTVQQN